MGLENFYHDEPLFGLDIGHSSIKVMQLEFEPDKLPKVAGYGLAKFPSSAIVNGVISNFDEVSKVVHSLFKNDLRGSIYTRRVACSLPTSHTFSRLLKLPVMPSDDIIEAIKLEAEQYIPMPVDNLYIDYEVSSRTAQDMELLMVAAPRVIVDSYVKLLQSLDLDPVAIEPSMNATSRLFGIADASHTEPSILIDFGSIAIDVAVFDKTMIVNSTLAGGSEMITRLISEAMGIDEHQAYEMKSKYGIGVSENQQQIAAAIAPVLDALVKEVRKITRYYDDRVGQSKNKIAHIITSGGGATMPGINQYLSQQLNLPAKTLNPWQNLDFGHLKKPSELEQSAYITVAGEASLNPKDIFV
ncbi:MAG TPA: type IV pilus assembly protein PilM [Candidatus Binatia bacterium]|nr:type IV pilus assembly protein PilM [Candidatus Binatia bacterium]